MIGIVVVGYGGFAEHLLISLQVAQGKQDHIMAVEITPSNDKPMIEKNREALRKAIQSVDQGQGVIVCTDSMAEDAGMIAGSMTQDAIVEILFGVNLPMLSHIALTRGQLSIVDVASGALTEARKAITHQSTGPTT